MLQPIASLGKGAILEKVFSPDKSLVAIVTSSYVDIYYAESLVKVKQLNTNFEILAVQFSPDNNYFCYTTKNNLLFLHTFSNNETSGLPIYNEIQGLEFADQRTQNMYEFSKGVPVATAITFTANEEYLIVGFVPNLRKYQNVLSKMTYEEASEFENSIPGQSIAIWSIAKNQIKMFINIDVSRLGMTRLMSISVSENSKYLAALIGNYGSVKGPTVWNFETGKLIHELKNLDYDLDELLFWEVDKLILACSGDTIYVNDLDSGKLTGKYFIGLEENLPKPIFEIFERRYEKGKLLEEISSHFTDYSDPIFILAISPDNKFIASGGNKPIINLWDISKETKIKSFIYTANYNSGFRSVNFSPDGKYLVAVSYKKTVIVWNIDTEEMIYHLQTDAVYYRPGGSRISGNDKKLAVFSPDGKYLAMGGGNLAIVEFFPDGTVHDHIEVSYMLLNDHFSFSNESDNLLSKYNFYQLCFSPNGRYVAQSYHGILFVYDLANNGKSILAQRFTKPRVGLKKVEVDDIHYLKFLPDNQRIFVVTQSGEFLLNLNEERNELELAIYTTTPFSFENRNSSGNTCLSSNGKLIVNSNMYGETILMDFPSGDVRKKYKGFQETINHIQFSDDGSLIAAGGREGIIKVWNVENY